MTKYIFYSYKPNIIEHESYIPVYQPTVDKPRKPIGWDYTTCTKKKVGGRSNVI